MRLAKRAIKAKAKSEEKAIVMLCTCTKCSGTFRRITKADGNKLAMTCECDDPGLPPAWAERFPNDAESNAKVAIRPFDPVDGPVAAELIANVVTRVDLVIQPVIKIIVTPNTTPSGKSTLNDTKSELKDTKTFRITKRSSCDPATFTSEQIVTANLMSCADIFRAAKDGLDVLEIVAPFNCRLVVETRD